MISWNLKTRSCQPIGLDIGSNSVKMIQLAVAGSRAKVVAADKVRIDSAVNEDEQERKSFVVSAIKKILAEGKFHTRVVVSSLPNNELKMTSLRLGRTEGEQIEQVLRKEAAQRFGLDPDRDVIDYLDAGSVRQGDEIKNELILFAADNETIKSHIEILEQARLKPIAIEPVACALFRSFQRQLRRQEDKELTVVFVDVGSRFTTVVFSRGGEITFAKHIPIGGEEFNQEIAAKLGVSLSEAEMLREKLRVERTTTSAANTSQNLAGQTSLDAPTQQIMVDAISSVAEKLASEISLCFRYYTVTFRGKRVERAFFAGGGAYEDILLNILKRQLAVEIEIAEPLRGFDITNIDFDCNRRDLLCEWAVAVGLSLKGWNQTQNAGEDYD